MRASPPTALITVVALAIGVLTPVTGAWNAAVAPGTGQVTARNAGCTV